MAELLRTKYLPPRLRSPLVARPLLLARLEQVWQHRLALLAAPAGFGKSTLVGAWLADHTVRHDPRPIAWLMLDSGDNDPARFWRYVIGACQPFFSQTSNAVQLLLEGPGPLRIDALLITFLNDLTQLPQPLVLVLEDYHLIQQNEIHQQLAQLIMHLPDSFHIVVVARSDPPLQLARLRARGEMFHLHAADLRFSYAETQALIEVAANVLPTAMIHELVQRTEGWPAGLRLALQALQAQPSEQAAERVLGTFGGGHEYVLAYLTAEVLEAQPPELQRFLLETSALDSRVCGDLADAVTGGQNGAQLLAQIAQAGLFLEPLGGEPLWYRYHTLFGEAMRHEARHRLGAQQLANLQMRASHWFAEHSMFSEAIEAALAARAFPEAAALIEHLLMRHRQYGQLYTMRRWIEALPTSLLPQYPELCLIYATVFLFLEDRSSPHVYQRFLVPLEMAEHSWSATNNNHRLGAALAIRSLAATWQGDYEQATRAAFQSLALLPEHDEESRAISLLQVGMTLFANGQLSQAHDYMLQAQACFESVGNRYGSRSALLGLGVVAIERAEFALAAHIFDQVAASANSDPVDMGHILVSQANLALLAGDLARAEQAINQALAITANDQVFSEQATDHNMALPATVAQARLLRIRGDYNQARAVLATFTARTMHIGGEPLRRAVQTEQARLALDMGDLIAAQRWATTTAQLSGVVGSMQQEREALLVVRLLIAQGETDMALRALEQRLVDAQNDGRVVRELEITELIAQALATANREQEALTILAHLVQRARVLGIALQGGPISERLLRRIHGTPAAPTPHEPDHMSIDASSASGDTFFEPLSGQEQRVLRLLAAGLSNPEIADELVVSVNTVKTHVQSIYRKLGINSRREARALLLAPQRRHI